MKPWLTWTLIGTLALSAWAIWSPVQNAPQTSQASNGGALASDLPPELHEAARTSPSGSVVSAGQAVPLQPLPSDLPQPQLEAAAADPFVGLQPPAPPPSPVVAAVPVAPPAPVAPTLNYRFLGRVVDPDGKTQIYLSRADKDLLVAQGTHLDEGYVVEGIKPDAVLVYYPPLDIHTQIRIPPPDTTP